MWTDGPILSISGVKGVTVDCWPEQRLMGRVSNSANYPQSGIRCEQICLCLPQCVCDHVSYPVCAGPVYVCVDINVFICFFLHSFCLFWHFNRLHVVAVIITAFTLKSKHLTTEAARWSHRGSPHTSYDSIKHHKAAFDSMQSCYAGLPATKHFKAITAIFNALMTQQFFSTFFS